jgi:hypothetical protein
MTVQHLRQHAMSAIDWLRLFEGNMYGFVEAVGFAGRALCVPHMF